MVLLARALAKGLPSPGLDGRLKERDTMQPLQELLHRIAWDPEFGRGRFALGYRDRVAGQEQVVPLTAVTFDRDRPGMFSVADEDGTVTTIPLHRVRTVYKDGDVIWRRPAPPPHACDANQR